MSVTAAELDAQDPLGAFVDEFYKHDRQGANIISMISDEAFKIYPPLLDRCRQINLTKPSQAEFTEALAGFAQKFSVSLQSSTLLREMTTRSNCTFRGCFQAFAAAADSAGRILDEKTLDLFLPPIRRSLMQ